MNCEWFPLPELNFFMHSSMLLNRGISIKSIAMSNHMQLNNVECITLCYGKSAIICLSNSAFSLNRLQIFGLTFLASIIQFFCMLKQNKSKGQNASNLHEDILIVSISVKRFFPYNMLE